MEARAGASDGSRSLYAAIFFLATATFLVVIFGTGSDLALLGFVFGEVIGVKVDDGAEKDPKLGGAEHRRGILKDALEGGLAGFQDFGFVVALGFVLCLLLLELRFALLFPALLFLLVLRSLPLKHSLTLRGFLLRVGLWRGCHDRPGVGGLLCRYLAVMHWAMLVRANRQFAAKLLAVDDDWVVFGRRFPLGYKLIKSLLTTAALAYHATSSERLHHSSLNDCLRLE